MIRNRYSELLDSDYIEVRTPYNEDSYGNYIITVDKLDVINKTFNFGNSLFHNGTWILAKDLFRLNRRVLLKIAAPARFTNEYLSTNSYLAEIATVNNKRQDIVGPSVKCYQWGKLINKHYHEDKLHYLFGAAWYLEDRSEERYFLDGIEYTKQEHAKGASSWLFR